MRREFKSGTVWVQGSRVTLTLGSFDVLVEAVPQPGQAVAAYHIDATRYLKGQLKGAVIFSIMGTLLLLVGDATPSPSFIATIALILLLGSVIWVGYGNLLLSYWGLTRGLNKSLKAASRAASAAPAG